VGTAAGFWKREEIGRLVAVNTLFAPDRIVANFSDMDRAFLTVALPSRPGAPLPNGPAMTLPAEATPWIDDRAVTGLVVLRGGSVRHESYHLGTGRDDLRISWSLAKSVLSLLTGILIEEGHLALSDPVTTHAPLLIGSAYDGATVEDVLQMESGVTFDEDYLDRGSDINRMGRVLALGGTLDDFTAALRESWTSPGSAMRYVSMDTHVLGMVLRGATGETVPDLVSDRLAGPLGIGPGYYLTDGTGVAFVLGGLNLTTRDYARIGQVVVDGGRVDGRQVVPEAWIDASTRPSARTRPGRMRYGYQWWMPADARPGEAFGQGIYGQFLYVDRMRDVVIAVNAADRAFRAPGVQDANIAMLRRIAAATDR
jgi:CubicO group peptidase (beta-lactamase class C family)